MKIAFHGAARTVTGSKHLITLKNGKKILLDCGMFQGLGKETDALNSHLGFDATEISAMILSHAHIDHRGLIPKLVKDGFAGIIFCTPATKDLASILMQDSAIIQRDDTKFINKKREKLGQRPIEPIYDLEDAQKAIDFLSTIEYHQWFDVIDGVQAMFTDAGHIIGSACVHLKITEDGTTTHLTFSGDVGRYRDIILKSPETFPQADYIIMESPYGNSLHDDVVDATNTLMQWIEKTIIQKKR